VTAQLADELVKAIRRPADIQKLDVARTVRFRNVAFGGATALGGVFMALNFTKLLDDVENGMSHEQEEARTKLKIGAVDVLQPAACGVQVVGVHRERSI